MKKLDEIPTATRGEAYPGDETDRKKDQLIDRLNSEGRHPIFLGRAIAVIEQCEAGDDYPEGWSDDPLKLSIYPDPDATGNDKPNEIYIYGGRYGLSETYLKTYQQQLWRFLPVKTDEARKIESVGSSIARAEMLLQLTEQSFSLLNGLYTEKRENGVGFKQDKTLEKLGEDVIQSIKAYLEYLRALPNVWSGDWDTPPNVQ